MLTVVYGIPAERLYVTYFEGDPSANLEPDEEAQVPPEGPAGHNSDAWRSRPRSRRGGSSMGQRRGPR